MKCAFCFLTFFFSTLTFSQTIVNYTAIDKKMDAVPPIYSNSTDSIAKFIHSHFKTENDKIRAVFYWTSSTISYDVKNMFVVNYEETKQDRITKTLKTKKGICGDYAAIFTEIATKLNIKSVVISGYTKQNGKVDNLSHAWCAAKIEGKWFLFDPTWGAGGLTNGKFVKKLNNYYFKTEPSKLISSHMPFDYLWQCLPYPITNNEFYLAKTLLDKTKKLFDFEKEIVKQNGLPEIDQLFESATRIEKNGLKNTMIVTYHESIKQHIAHLRQADNVEKTNGIVAEMNAAVALLNDFIFYRNNKFKPNLPDNEISEMIQKPKQKLVKCQNDSNKILSSGSENASNLEALKKTIASNLTLAEEHETFVKNYLSKSKIVRKTMFSKASWFGIPLN